MKFKRERRKFLVRLTAGISALMLTEQSCKTNDSTNGPGIGSGGYSFGTGDIAILNYLYVLEQVSAAFYIQASTTMYLGASADEKLMMADITRHEITHREFLKTALGSNALPLLQLDFSSVDFSSKSKVLATALFLEDLGIKSGNSAALSIQSSSFMTIAAQIISVESRHATYIHELIDNFNANSFTGGNLTDTNSLEIALKPQDALILLNPYIKTKLDSGSIHLS